MTDLERYYYDSGLKLKQAVRQYPAGHEVYSCKVGGVQKSAASVVWYIHHGTWEIDLDHINRNPKDNRIENLRKVSRSLQVQNTRARGALPKGVTKNHRRYMAQTKRNQKRVYLGTYDTPEEAHKAYVSFWGEVGDE